MGVNLLLRGAAGLRVVFPICISISMIIAEQKLVLLIRVSTCSSPLNCYSLSFPNSPSLTAFVVFIK